MDNAATIEKATRIEMDIEARIAAGESPPRPLAHEPAYRTWYEKHIRCVEPSHAYFVRERGNDRCDVCTRGGTITFAPIDLSIALSGFNDNVRDENDCEPAEPPPRPKRTPRKL